MIDQRHHADQRHGGDAVHQHRQKRDHGQGDGRQRAEQPGAGTSRRTAFPSAPHKHLEDPNQYQHRQPNVPGELHRRVMVAREPLVPGLHHGHQHQKRHPKRAGRVQAEGHGGHVVAAHRRARRKAMNV